jgi:hypothetical protein
VQRCSVRGGGFACPRQHSNAEGFSYTAIRVLRACTAQFPDVLLPTLPATVITPSGVRPSNSPGKQARAAGDAITYDPLTINS